MSEEKEKFRKAWAERLLAIRQIPPILRIVWESGPATVVCGVAVRLISSLLPIAILAIGKLIIDHLVQVVAHHQPASRDLWWLVAAEFGLAVTGSVLTRVTDFLDTLLAEQYTRHVSIKVMRHAGSLDLTSYEDPVFYDRLERARVQATDRLMMIQLIGRLITEAVTAASLSITIAYFSPWLLVILVGGIIPAFVGESRFAFLGYAQKFRQTPARRQMDYLRILAGSREAAKELRLFGLSEFLTERFGKLAADIYVEDVSLAKRKFRAGVVFSMLATVGYYLAYTWVIWRALIGALSIGSLYYLAGAILQASNNIQQMFSTASNIADQALFLNDLLAFFEMKPAIHSRANALPAPRPIVNGFEFRDVSFCYPGSTRPVLNHLNFTLSPGERVALIGENGEGKTTIVKLLTRLYDPTGGQILLDGVDLREYSLEDLYREIGVIFQDFMRYEMTARENIAIGRIEELDSIEMIEEAAHKSLADEVIEKLPASYQQMLGRRFVAGMDLSGGEWQKMALARAYLRDAQLLILDEPTAALDARSEFEVFARIADLTEGKTTLFISHRFSTVRMADRIVVLEHGRIAEDGNHRQLMALGGRYAEMFELQAASYR